MLCNVGCCYHHLNEQFYQNPNMTTEENRECNSNPGKKLLLPVLIGLNNVVSMQCAVDKDKTLFDW